MQTTERYFPVVLCMCNLVIYYTVQCTVVLSFEPNKLTNIIQNYTSYTMTILETKIGLLWSTNLDFNAKASLVPFSR